MMEIILKTILSGVTESVKLTTEAAILKVEQRFDTMRQEAREMLSESLHQSQLMLIETIVIGFLFVMGIFYLGGGITKIIDFYMEIEGLGGVILGGTILIIGILILKNSSDRIKAIKKA